MISMEFVNKKLFQAGGYPNTKEGNFQKDHFVSTCNAGPNTTLVQVVGPGA